METPVETNLHGIGRRGCFPPDSVLGKTHGLPARDASYISAALP